jgi:hypothetical protein
LQRQVSKQAVLAPDPQIQGHVSERAPAASRRPVSVRDRRVSRLSSSFFGSLFFMDWLLSVELYNGREPGMDTAPARFPTSPAGAGSVPSGIGGYLAGLRPIPAGIVRPLAKFLRIPAGILWSPSGIVARPVGIVMSLPRRGPKFAGMVTSPAGSR